MPRLRLTDPRLVLPATRVSSRRRFADDHGRDLFRHGRGCEHVPGGPTVVIPECSLCADCDVQRFGTVLTGRSPLEHVRSNPRAAKMLEVISESHSPSVALNMQCLREKYLECWLLVQHCADICELDRSVGQRCGSPDGEEHGKNQSHCAAQRACASAAGPARKMVANSRRHCQASAIQLRWFGPRTRKLCRAAQRRFVRPQDGLRSALRVIPKLAELLRAAAGFRDLCSPQDCGFA